jgi:hypothetical protein
VNCANSPLNRDSSSCRERNGHGWTSTSSEGTLLKYQSWRDFRYQWIVLVCFELPDGQSRTSRVAAFSVNSSSRH